MPFPTSISVSRRTFLSLGLVLVAAIILGSLMPNPPHVPRVREVKIGHVLAYAGLMLWFAQAFNTRGQRAATAVALIALGVLLEFLQGMTGYRSFAVNDMRDNAIGVALGLAISFGPGGRLVRVT